MTRSTGQTRWSSAAVNVYVKTLAPSGVPAKAVTQLTGEMGYRTELYNPGPGLEKSTRIYLYNTPVVAPLVTHTVTSAQQGVANNTSARLYDMEYVPGCTEAGLDFSNNLASNGTGAKNTARIKALIDFLVDVVRANQKQLTPRK